VDPNLKARIEKLEKEVEELKAETKARTGKSLLKD
jgi:tetrahydromethanopterin S-methyltransferase subunit G